MHSIVYKFLLQTVQAYIDRPREDATVQYECLTETVYVQTENNCENASTQTICAEVTGETYSSLKDVWK